MIPGRCESDLNVSDPGPSTSSSRDIMPRNEPRQKIKRRLRSNKDKLNAIMRVHNGESKAAVAHRCARESTLRGWCKAKEKIILQVNNITANLNSLHHLHVPPPNSATGVTFNAVDINNDDIDDETVTKNDPDISPSDCNKMVEYCEKLLEWLHWYGTSITTMKEVGHLQHILAYLQEVNKELT